MKRIRMTLAACVPLATILAGCGADETGAPAPTPSLEIRQLTENAYFDANPVFSADGAWIYYESDQTGDRELWRLAAAGGTPQRLTFHRGFDSSPDPLPDGSGVVFESDRAGTKDIWLLPVDPEGAAPTRLTAGDSEDGSPAVSPDGDRVVFESNRDKASGSDLWVLRLADGRLSRLTTTPTGVYVRTADWSPDGAFVVAESNVSGASALHAIRVAGGEFRQLTPDVGYEGHPAWSPDGETIACESNRSGTMEIHLVPADGGTPAPLTRGGGFWPQWSPDGRTLVCGLPAPAAPEVGTVKLGD